MASRKSANQKFDKVNSEERRNVLETDVEMFLKNGGKIQEVPLGMSGEQNFLKAGADPSMHSGEYHVADIPRAAIKLEITTGGNRGTSTYPV
jgi:hypothetical protein